MRRICIAAAAALVSIGVASAAETKAVKIANADFDRPTVAAELYAKLSSAARRVCAKELRGSFAAAATHDRCARTALARAVKSSQMEPLIAYHAHMETNGDAEGALLAAARAAGAPAVASVEDDADVATGSIEPRSGAFGRAAKALIFWRE